MSEPFLSEVQMFGGTFAPRGWLFCDGQLLPISQNTALFSLLGTMYGGDGRTTFGLPDLRGRAPIGAGEGPGLSPVQQGARLGTETVTLTAAQLPSHRHALDATTAAATTRQPEGNRPATARGVGLYADVGSMTDMAGQTLIAAGGGQPHNNMQPFLTVSFIIAVIGVFPPRS